MPCERCGADDATASGWCEECERHLDLWHREHAADIIWQAFTGAIVAMVIGLGALVLGLSPLVSIAGVLAGVGTFAGVRRWSQRRRRRQLAAGPIPRATLRPPRT